jgi:NAD+--dinitrogen-reductase ADP-D-ribosyltransferase
MPSASAEAALNWYTTHTAALTACGVPAGVIASAAFQDDPHDLDLAWVRREHGGLLAALARIADAEERADLFHHYTLTRPWAHEHPGRWPSAKERAGYAAVLRGWGIDSNGASGAVLKGWAERRFGLRPIWHRTALSDADAQLRYAAERERGALGAIGMQLDLLYTYVQDELRRRHGGERWLTLWRGSHDAELYEVKSGGDGGIIEFNNASSFTTDREVAWEFGSRVWQVRVPLAKIVLAPGMLPAGLLQGESECIVLGGDYRVTALIA